MTHPKRAALAAALHLALFGAVVAWSQEEPAQAPALVSPLAAVVGQPFATGPIDGSIPPIDATGFLQEPAVSLLSPLVAHEGRFTWGLDLPTQPINIFITTSESTWKTLFDPGAPILEHTASPKLPVYMNGILDEAHAHQDEFKTAVAGVDKVLEEFAHVLDPALAAIPDSPASSFFGYRPLRARWLHSRWWAPELIPLPEVELVYPDYSGFGDVRQRGARLYCAARRGQREQDQALQQGKPATSLGERAAFSFNLLGQTIDLLALTSTVVFNGPQRCIGGGADAPACAGASGPAPADGAQAFEIPLLLGHRLTPIRGLGLPGLPEVQVPLVLVSGDSEVQTATDKRAVFLGFDSPCPACAPQPKFEVMHSKAYRTVSHADAALSASRGYHLAGSFPFFLLGPVVVSFDLNFDYTFGELLNPHDRVIQTDPPLSLWPKPTRPGWLFSNGTGGVRYHEGPWRLQATRIGGQPALTWTVLPHGMTSSLWREPLLPFFRPHDLQALTDDDHALRSRTHVKLGGAISGQLGADIGPFETTLTVKGRPHGDARPRPRRSRRADGAGASARRPSHAADAADHGPQRAGRGRVEPRVHGPQREAALRARPLPHGHRVRQAAVQHSRCSARASGQHRQPARRDTRQRRPARAAARDRVPRRPADAQAGRRVAPAAGPRLRDVRRRRSHLPGG
jgi:hypothetical protein